MSRTTTDTALRAQLAKLLDWEDAHVGFDKAVKGIPPRLRGAVPNGLEHSVWQLVEHTRIAQADIVEFCGSGNYQQREWPADYWPRTPQPPGGAAWTRSIAGFKRDRQSLKRLATNPRVDLFAAIPHRQGQTYLRELLLIADHTAYHVGQIVAVRRALGIW